MPDLYWLISSRRTDIPIDYVVGGGARPTPKRGGSITLECVFTPDEGAPDYDAIIGGARGVLATQDARYDALAAYGAFSNTTRIITSTDGEAYLHEDISGRSDVDTQFVLVTPPEHIVTDPFYAAVTDVTDATARESAHRRLDVDLTYLGAESEWVSWGNARDDLVA